MVKNLSHLIESKHDIKITGDGQYLARPKKGKKGVEHSTIFEKATNRKEMEVTSNSAILSFITISGLTGNE